MSPEQLDEIEKLAEAATPGPYQAASVYPAYGVFRVEVDEPSECIAMCAVSVNEDADEPHVERQEAHARNGANARAIAVLLKHALPLIKALREAREDAHKHREDALAWVQVSFEHQRERDAAKAEVAKLRSALAAVDRIAGEMEEAATPHGYTGQMVRAHSKWAAKIAEALDPVRLP